jgi:hypothetical protein
MPDSNSIPLQTYRWNRSPTVTLRLRRQRRDNTRPRSTALCVLRFRRAPHLIRARVLHIIQDHSLRGPVRNNNITAVLCPWRWPYGQNTVINSIIRLSFDYFRRWSRFVPDKTSRFVICLMDRFACVCTFTSERPKVVRGRKQILNLIYIIIVIVVSYCIHILLARVFRFDSKI